MFDDILFQGLVERPKEGLLQKKTKQVYCVVCSSSAQGRERIECYKSREAYKESAPESVIVLTNCVAVREAETNQNNSAIQSVHLLTDGGQSHIFLFRTAVELSAFKNAIAQAVGFTFSSYGDEKQTQMQIMPTEVGENVNGENEYDCPWDLVPGAAAQSLGLRGKFTMDATEAGLVLKSMDLVEVIWNYADIKVIGCKFCHFFILTASANEVIEFDSFMIDKLIASISSCAQLRFIAADNNTAFKDFQLPASMLNQGYDFYQINVETWNMENVLIQNQNCQNQNPEENNIKTELLKWTHRILSTTTSLRDNNRTSYKKMSELKEEDKNIDNFEKEFSHGLQAKLAKQNSYSNASATHQDEVESVVAASIASVPVTAAETARKWYRKLKGKMALSKHNSGPPLGSIPDCDDGDDHGFGSWNSCEYPRPELAKNAGSRSSWKRTSSKLKFWQNTNDNMIDNCMDTNESIHGSNGWSKGRMDPEDQFMDHNHCETYDALTQKPSAKLTSGAISNTTTVYDWQHPGGKYGITNLAMNCGSDSWLDATAKDNTSVATNIIYNGNNKFQNSEPSVTCDRFFETTFNQPSSTIKSATLQHESFPAESVERGFNQFSPDIPFADADKKKVQFGAVVHIQPDIYRPKLIDNLGTVSTTEKVPKFEGSKLSQPPPLKPRLQQNNFSLFNQTSPRCQIVTDV